MDANTSAGDMNTEDEPDAEPETADAAPSGACAPENIEDYLASAEEISTDRYRLAGEHLPVISLVPAVEMETIQPMCLQPRLLGCGCSQSNRMSRV